MSQKQENEGNKTTRRFTDERIEDAKKQWLWHYVVSQMVQMSLALIAETIPGTLVGLILPLQKKRVSRALTASEELAEVGLSLVGWLDENGSNHLFLESKPEFKYGADYHIERLGGLGNGLLNSAFLVVPRRTGSLSFIPEVRETVSVLLSFLYEYKDEWASLFKDRTYSLFQPMKKARNGATATESSSFIDEFSNELADAIIRLGNFSHQLQHMQQTWKFCCVLQTKEPYLPIQQQNLTVYAQSKEAPHRVGITTVSADKDALCLSLRAYQSGYVNYIGEVIPGDIMIEFLADEGNVRSAIALPVGGEHGKAVAVLYVVSNEPDAFSVTDVRILRFAARMIENLFSIYRNRQQTTGYLVEMVRHPYLVDTSFAHFSFENEFRRDVNMHLQRIFDNYRQGQQTEGAISFIAIAIDHADTYGSVATHNLSRAMGNRIQLFLNSRFENHPLYYIYADKFFLLMPDVTTLDARTKATRLKEVLQEPYRVDVQNTSFEGLDISGKESQPVKITVRLAVTTYSHEKVVGIIEQYENIIPGVSIHLRSTLERGLRMGEENGGNKVMIWSSESMFESWP